MKNDKNQLVHRAITTPMALHIREKGGGEAPSRTIEGYAVLFDTPSEPLWNDEQSEAREIIDPTAITREFLDTQDIKMTMFHDRQLILARSNKGEGTLKYDVDEKGVAFSFDAPNTADGDKALELVKRGDISGCSFMFATRYYDETCVEHKVEQRDGKVFESYRVKSILGVYDFTLAADPAYPDTTVEARELANTLRHSEPPEADKAKQDKERKVREQVADMRRIAAMSI